MLGYGIKINTKIGYDLILDEWFINREDAIDRLDYLKDIIEDYADTDEIEKEPEIVYTYGISDNVIPECFGEQNEHFRIMQNGVIFSGWYPTEGIADEVCNYYELMHNDEYYNAEINHKAYFGDRYFSVVKEISFEEFESEYLI